MEAVLATVHTHLSPFTHQEHVDMATSQYSHLKCMYSIVATLRSADPENHVVVWSSRFLTRHVAIRAYSV